MFSRLFTNNALVTRRLFSSAARPLLQTTSLIKSAPTSLIIPRQQPLPPPLLPLADQLMRILYRERQQTIQSSILDGGLQALNRNARRPKRANRGKRPISSVQRKNKTRNFGRKGHN